MQGLHSLEGENIMGIKDEDLKSCPFCGNKNTYLKMHIRTGFDTWYVGCNTEGCHAEKDTWKGVPYKTEQEAIEAWNKRKEKT